MCATLQATPTSAGQMGRCYHENATSMFIPPPNKHICASFAVLQLWFAYALSYWKLVPNVAVLRSDATFSSWLDRSPKLVLSFCAQDWTAVTQREGSRLLQSKAVLVFYFFHMHLFTRLLFYHIMMQHKAPHRTQTPMWSSFGNYGTNTFLFRVNYPFLGTLLQKKWETKTSVIIKKVKSCQFSV